MMPPGLTRYIAFMSTLSEARLSELPEIVTDDMSFQDPFNNLRGREAFARCLHEMLGQLADLKITVTHVGELLDPAGEGAARYVLRWTFGGRLTKLGNRPWQVTGMSEVTLAGDGRVNSHIDYWDAAQGLYEKLPLVGDLMRWLRRHLAVRGVTQH
jgi:steroid delta-isomerase